MVDAGKLTLKFEVDMAQLQMAMQQGAIYTNEFKAKVEGLTPVLKQSEQAATTMAVRFQTLTQGTINLTTAFAQTYTSMSNLTRTQHAVTASTVGLDRAQDNLARKQNQLNKEMAKAHPDLIRVTQLTNELQTSQERLGVATDRLADATDRAKDTQILFGINILNVGFSAIQTLGAMRKMTQGLEAAKVAQGALTLASNPYLLVALAIIAAWEAGTLILRGFNNKLADQLSIVKNITNLMDELSGATKETGKSFTVATDSMGEYSTSADSVTSSLQDLTSAFRKEYGEQSSIVEMWKTKGIEAHRQMRDEMTKTKIEQNKKAGSGGSQTPGKFPPGIGLEANPHVTESDKLVLDQWWKEKQSEPFDNFFGLVIPAYGETPTSATSPYIQRGDFAGARPYRVDPTSDSMVDLSINPTAIDDKNKVYIQNVTAEKIHDASLGKNNPIRLNVDNMQFGLSDSIISGAVNLWDFLGKDWQKKGVTVTQAKSGPLVNNNLLISTKVHTQMQKYLLGEINDQGIPTGINNYKNFLYDDFIYGGTSNTAYTQLDATFKEIERIEKIVWDGTILSPNQEAQYFALLDKRDKQAETVRQLEMAGGSTKPGVVSTLDLFLKENNKIKTKEWFDIYKSTKGMKRTDKDYKRLLFQSFNRKGNSLYEATINKAGLTSDYVNVAMGIDAYYRDHIVAEGGSLGFDYGTNRGLGISPYRDSRYGKYNPNYSGGERHGFYGQEGIFGNDFDANVEIDEDGNLVYKGVSMADYGGKGGKYYKKKKHLINVNVKRLQTHQDITLKYEQFAGQMSRGSTYMPYMGGSESYSETVGGASRYRTRNNQTLRNRQRELNIEDINRSKLATGGVLVGEYDLSDPNAVVGGYASVAEYRRATDRKRDQDGAFARSLLAGMGIFVNMGSTKASQANGNVQAIQQAQGSIALLEEAGFLGGVFNYEAAGYFANKHPGPMTLNDALVWSRMVHEDNLFRPGMTDTGYSAGLTLYEMNNAKGWFKPSNAYGLVGDLEWQRAWAAHAGFTPAQAQAIISMAGGGRDYIDDIINFKDHLSSISTGTV